MNDDVAHPVRLTLDELLTRVGQEIAVSPWLAVPQAPPPKVPITTTTSAPPLTRPTLPPPPAPVKRPLMSRSQLNWTLWLMFMAVLSVFAWWLV